jgi:chromosome segregation ATPase
VTLTELWPYIQAVGAFAVGVFGKWFLDWLRAKNEFRLKDRELDIKEDEQESKQDLALAEQITKTYREIVDRLEKRIDYLEEKVSKLEKQHEACTEDNHKLKASIAIQGVRIDEQQREIIRLTNAVAN